MESPGSSFAYSYDLAGNRTGVTVGGIAILTDTYDAADQVVGWTYDNAGNLTNDGVTNYSYDATNDLTGTTTTGQSRAYSYNGDSTLVAQTANGTTTNYTQDLATAQSQILAGTTGITTTDYLYGQDIAPLAALTNGTRTWYGIDGQGSVRQSLDDSGNILGVQSYDPFGQIEAGSSLIGPFGYTGELQDPTTGQEYPRARWYQPGSGTLLGVDPMIDQTGQPYGYAGEDPVNGSDPSGNCTSYLGLSSFNMPGLASQLCMALTTSGSAAQAISSAGGLQSILFLGGNGTGAASNCLGGTDQPSATQFQPFGDTNLLSTTQRQPGEPVQSPREDLWLHLQGTPGLGGSGSYGTGITSDTYNLDYQCRNAAVLGFGAIVPLPGGPAACAGDKDAPLLPPGSTLIIVRFITACQYCGSENHSMIFTTAGQGGGATWKTELENPGQTIHIKGPAPVTDVHNLADDYLSDNATPFWLISRKPISWINGKLRAMAQKINPLRLEYLPLVRNCNTFTHTALLRLGFTDGDSDGHIPSEHLVTTIGWNSPMPGI